MTFLLSDTIIQVYRRYTFYLLSLEFEDLLAQHFLEEKGKTQAGKKLSRATRRSQHFPFSFTAMSNLLPPLRVHFKNATAGHLGRAAIPNAKVRSLSAHMIQLVMSRDGEDEVYHPGVGYKTTTLGQD